MLTGHSAGVESRAVSPDGRYLVSGGKLSFCLLGLASHLDPDDAASVLVWNLLTGELVQSIHCPFNGAISAVVWVCLRDTHDFSFVFGCADGSLHLYRRKSLNVRRDVLIFSLPAQQTCRSISNSSPSIAKVIMVRSKI